jgi:hypothetical protein
MTLLRSRRRIVSIVIAIVLLLPFSPALANGERGVVVKFTKWVTGVVPAIPAEGTSRRILMEGFVGRDVDARNFAGEALDRQASTPAPLGTVTTPIAALQAIYEVRAGDHSFTALIQGGSNSAGEGLLDGVILDGWRRGARVHVEFRTIASCDGNPNQTGPLAPCFRGTIRILPNSDDF